MTLESSSLKSSLGSHALHVNLQRIEDENAQLQAELKAARAENARLQAEVSRLNQEVGQMIAYIKQMRQALHGFSSEKMAALPLFSSSLPEEQGEEEDAKKPNVIAITAHQRIKPGRRPLPETLQREEIIHDLSPHEKVCGCGHALSKIGEERTEQLTYIPAVFKARVHVRCKYACRNCEEGVKIAPLPPQPIPQSIASPELLAHLIVAKYADHLPLYRLEQILKRQGIDLSRHTMCQWVIRVAALFEPVVKHLRLLLLDCDYVQADETTVQVLKEPGRSAQSLSYMWLYRAAALLRPIIIFEYHPNRKQEIPELFLESFAGYLQNDGYGGYNRVREKGTVTGMGCWAHVRRKFVDIVKMSKTPGEAAYAIEQIAKLYALEARARQEGLSPPEIQALREREARPVLNAFKAWLDRTVSRTAPKGMLGKAIRYALNQWEGLTVYLNDGRLQIDNNGVENAIRPFAIGRKNWLFMDTVQGAKAGATLYSIFATCKANNVDPYAYLCKALTLLPACSPDDDMTPFLPCNLLAEPAALKAA